MNELKLVLGDETVVKGTAYKTAIYALLCERFIQEVSPLTDEKRIALNAAYNIIFESTESFDEAEALIYSQASLKSFKTGGR